MTDFSEAAVRKALDDHVLNNPGLAGITIAWEDVPFSPQTGRPWIATQILSRVDSALGVQAGSTIETAGDYQLNIATPAGQGPYGALRIIDVLKPYYNRGRTLIAQDGTRIIFGLRKIPRTYADGSWLRTPFIVPFSIYVQA